MSRINTNVQSMIAQRVLGTNNASLSTSLERLSTGLKINRGKDDPAGLIASENLKVEQRGIAAAITNAQRADQVANIADSGMAEISSMLSELQSLVTNTASKATQRAGLLRLPMRVLKPLIAKNRGNSSRSTTVSSCCSSLRRNGA